MRPNEDLLWLGGPDPDVVFSRGDLLLVPFSLLWGGFAIFWETSAITGGAPWFFRLWGVPFVLVGLYLMVGRFIHKRYRWQRTTYALTDKRALVIGPRSLTDTPLAAMPVSVRHSRDGRHATIAIGAASALSRPNFPVLPGTGFDASGGAAVTFHDVLDPQQLLLALDSARTT